MPVDGFAASGRGAEWLFFVVCFPRLGALMGLMVATSTTRLSVETLVGGAGLVRFGFRLSVGIV